MSDPVSLRNIPPDVLKLAHTLSVQTGLSLNAVLRLALTSGLLVEATKVSPGLDGTFAGWDGSTLAKALRRHLSSAIDMLIEYGEHPHAGILFTKQYSSHAREEDRPAPGTREHAIEDDLDTLGIGFGLSEALEDDR